ncbi:MAG: lysophospholipase [Aphanothece sp. CMT-3BRIN-NPC111]|nr:lysophospholipase [Aphanothece sp. CMT-3BRIN-NPC111]
MSDYSPVAKAIVEKAKAHEDALLLMDESCRTRFFLHSIPTLKVFLFFHGFTATPEQFALIGKVFFDEGYNVLIPLLPGHGLAGNWDGDNPPPLPENQQVYQEFGLYWLEVAQAVGKEVVLGGLSGGSTLAAWLALERPTEIDRALVFAPYLSGSNKVVDLFVRIFNIYFEWKTEPGLAHFGYDGFLMPALRVFLDMGNDILERSQHSFSAPMLIVSSESDRAVGDNEHEALFEAVVQHQPKSWYHRFEKVLDIPHNMMTYGEGNKHLGLLIAIAKAYVESDLTWAEVEEIGVLIKQGYSFKSVVNELNLSERVSPEIPLLWAVE